jgi:multisubunit Na+/H+ antiporter MnhG subunit
VTVQQIVADVLLGLAVALVLASCVGILVMRDTYQKLHYVTPAAVIAPLAVGLAVLVQSHWSENSLETWLAVLFMLISGPFLSHATIRAARIREQGDWRHGAEPAGRASGRAGERASGRSHG